MAHIQEAYRLDQETKTYKQLNKIQSNYFNFGDTFLKMKVKVAAQLLSQSVAASIETFYTLGQLPVESLFTAEFVSNIDKLFDSLNASTLSTHKGKPFACVVSNGSPHLDFWSQMLNQIGKWRILHKDSKKVITNTFHFVNGLTISLKSMRSLWLHLHEVGFDFLVTRSLNQDPAENLFCLIRQHGINNTNPDCHQFVAALKTVVINKIATLTLNSKNCEDDNCTPLFDFLKIVRDSPKPSELQFDNHSNLIDKQHLEIIEEKEEFNALLSDVNDNDINGSQATAYVAGYFIKKVGVPECDTCKIELLSLGPTNEHLFVSSLPFTGSLALQPGPSTDTRKSVFRGIKNLSKVDATPRKLRLIKMVESKEAHIRKLKKMSKRRAHDVKALCQLSDETVVRRLFDGMSSNTTDFLISQLRCAKRNPKGRRWTSQEKVVALALLKKSPRCYALSRKIVALPSKKTVLSLLEKIHFTPGINRHLFLHLKDFLDNDQDRCCALLFDEMDIMENIQYDQKGDCIVGYEHFGPEGPNSMTIAKKALLFMLVGLGEKKWKQPVAYYFSEKGCPAAILQMCIRNVIAAAQDLAQLDVVTTVCDMGSINIRTLKEMGCSVARPYFMVGDKKIFTMCDPPHLLKCTASLFRKHNIELPVEVLGNQVMEARFNDVRKAYEIDKNTPLVFRHLPKLRDEHLAPKMAYAMKVSIAGQIMSQSVASFLYTCTTAGELEQRAIATATFVQQVDSLFDSFNGRNTRREGSQECGKVLKYIITENSAHHEYWPKAFDMVKGWKYKRLPKTGRLNESKPPSQLGWLWSIKAIQSIWNYLHNVRNFKSLSPRRLNQDPAENTFGCIRGGCGSGDNPTALQLAANLKTQILNDLVHKPAKSNCEEDDSTLLSNLFAFISQGDSSSNSDVPETLAEPLPNETATYSHERMAEEIALAVHKGALATLSVAYVSGSIVRRLLSVVQDCESALLSSELDPHNLFISFKEWSDLNKLCYPTESVVTAVGLSITILEQVLKEHKRNLSSIITDTISRKVSFSFLTCEIHTADITKLIIKSIIKIGIPWFCKRMNRSLKDVRSAKRKLKTFTHS